MERGHGAQWQRASNETIRKYTWGLDLSGTIHGAGGIGGLLACEETAGRPATAKRYWFFYDANGNVGQVLDATNTNNITIAAKYEYDPYGNVIDQTCGDRYAYARQPLPLLHQVVRRRNRPGLLGLPLLLPTTRTVDQSGIRLGRGAALI